MGLKKGEEIGLKKGEEIGLKKGEEIGEKNAFQKLARLLKQSSFSIEEIIRHTGLTKRGNPKSRLVFDTGNWKF